MRNTDSDNVSSAMMPRAETMAARAARPMIRNEKPTSRESSSSTDPLGPSLDLTIS